MPQKMNADKVIEWITQEMGVILTTTQKDLIRMEFGEAIAYQRTQDVWAAGGYKFARLMVDAYREQDRPLWGWGVNKPYPRMDEAVYDEVTRIPDRVFMGPGAISYSDEALAQNVRNDIVATQEDYYQKQLASKVMEVQNKLEMVHGHGPATVEWETDFQNYASRGRVTMPYEEGCEVCELQRELRKLREETDG